MNFTIYQMYRSPQKIHLRHLKGNSSSLELLFFFRCLQQTSWRFVDRLRMVVVCQLTTNFLKLHLVSTCVQATTFQSKKRQRYYLGFNYTTDFHLKRCFVSNPLFKSQISCSVHYIYGVSDWKILRYLDVSFHRDQN